MTTRDQVNLSHALNLIASSTHELKQYWHDYLTSEYENSEDLSDRLFFEDMTKIAVYIIQKYKAKDTDNFRLIFSSFEDVFTHQDLNTCSCISAGILEGILSHESINYKTEFNNWLLPETKIWWNGAYEFSNQMRISNQNGS